MDRDTKAGRQHRLNEGLEEGRKLRTQRRVREQAMIRPFTPPGRNRTDPYRGTGEHGAESLDPGAPLTEEPRHSSADDVGMGESNR